MVVTVERDRTLTDSFPEGIASRLKNKVTAPGVGEVRSETVEDHKTLFKKGKNFTAPS